MAACALTAALALAAGPAGAATGPGGPLAEGFGWLEQAWHRLAGAWEGFGGAFGEGAGSATGANGKGSIWAEQGSAMDPNGRLDRPPVGSSSPQPADD